jgi:hypothetical protein
LTKSKEEGGLDLGTLEASMVIFGMFVICFIIEMYTLYKAKKLKAAKTAEGDDSTTKKEVEVTEEGDNDEDMVE